MVIAFIPRSIRNTFVVGLVGAFAAACAVESDEMETTESAASAASACERRRLQCSVVKPVTLALPWRTACARCEVRAAGYVLNDIAPATYTVNPGQYDLTSTGDGCTACVGPALRRISQSGGSCWTTSIEPCD
jgi:hypothetical protein